MSGDIYYRPENYGLTPVAELELADSYEFETTMVWKDAGGTLFFATSQGCSCPTPFEEYAGVNALNVLVSLEQLANHVREAFDHHFGSDDPADAEDKLLEFLTKVRPEMKPLDKQMKDIQEALGL